MIKFFANYCRACKSFEPKFVAIKEDEQLQNLPIVWAEFAALRSNRELFQKQLNILALPTIQFYDGGRNGLVENFPCGPSKIRLLKQKLAHFLNTRVDIQTRQLKMDDEPEQPQTQPRVQRTISTTQEMITNDHIRYLRWGMPFFKGLTGEEFDALMSKSKLLTFDPGDLIIQQGAPPTYFYVLKSGKVEMCVRSKFDDPILFPNYHGVVIHELHDLDYFGERALTTGEPYHATCRVVEKVRAFAFHMDDIPESSILSKKRKATKELVEKMNERYMITNDFTTPSIMSSSSMAAYDTQQPSGGDGGISSSSTSSSSGYGSSDPHRRQDHGVLELLVRFRQIRQAAKCFEYIMKSQPTLGNQGEIGRRSMLVSKLSKSQTQEFSEVFDMVDQEKKGKISLLEMRRFMQSARQNKSKDELMEMLARANPKFNHHHYGTTTTNNNTNNNDDDDYAISRVEFMGVMAEAEFDNLFTATFEELDEDQNGFVRASDLNQVLGGVRDLVSNYYDDDNDNKNTNDPSSSSTTRSLLNVDDLDMLIDYEQFSKLLLGATL